MILVKYGYLVGFDICNLSTDWKSKQNSVNFDKKGNLYRIPKNNCSNDVTKIRSFFSGVFNLEIILISTICSEAVAL